MNIDYDKAFVLLLAMQTLSIPDQMSLICMMVDTVSSETEIKPEKVLHKVTEMVLEVNKQEGAYRMCQF